MKVEFKAIEEADFKKMDSALIFETEHSRCYGQIFNENISFKFGWQSDLIIPEISEISENVYSLGIDLNFAIIDFKKNSIISNLMLDCFFIKRNYMKIFYILLQSFQSSKLNW